jgi:hypothetical protein
MEESIHQCLNLITKDNVDEVVQAFRGAYSWYVSKEFPAQESDKGVLSQFLNEISRTLEEHQYRRMILSEEERASSPFRHSSSIVVLIQEFMMPLKKNDGVTFLGRLVGAYGLAVPEPLFRTAKTYSRLHMTPDIPAIDDDLPMTDNMILYAWQYDWFYSWLGY